MNVIFQWHGVVNELLKPGEVILSMGCNLVAQGRNQVPRRDQQEDDSMGEACTMEERAPDLDAQQRSHESTKVSQHGWQQ